jgi:hypothetical protein
MKETFRLPNGKTTVSIRRYVKAWKDLAKPIEGLTNSKMWGFDPDLAFVQRVPANTSVGYREVNWRLDADKAILFGNLIQEVEILRKEM